MHEMNYTDRTQRTIIATTESVRYFFRYNDPARLGLTSPGFADDVLLVRVYEGAHDRRLWLVLSAQEADRRCDGTKEDV